MGGNPSRDELTLENLGITVNSEDLGKSGGTVGSYFTKEGKKSTRFAGETRFRMGVGSRSGGLLLEARSSLIPEVSVWPPSAASPKELILRRRGVSGTFESGGLLTWSYLFIS